MSPKHPSPWMQLQIEGMKMMQQVLVENTTIVMLLQLMLPQLHHEGGLYNCSKTLSSSSLSTIFEVERLHVLSCLSSDFSPIWDYLLTVRKERFWIFALNADSKPLSGLSTAWNPAVLFVHDLWVQLAPFACFIATVEANKEGNPNVAVCPQWIVFSFFSFLIYFFLPTMTAL